MKPLIVGIVLVFLGGVSFFYYKNANTMQIESSKVFATPKTPGTTGTEVNISATFKIITNGTVRIFADAKYHNQSDDVYIEKTNPGIIHVKKSGVTWDDFFKTLPMSLDKKCLVTGTKQTFCTQDGKKLKFEINDIENPDALDKIINDGDKLVVTF